MVNYQLSFLMDSDGKYRVGNGNKVSDHMFVLSFPLLMTKHTDTSTAHARAEFGVRHPPKATFDVVTTRENTRYQGRNADAFKAYLIVYPNPDLTSTWQCLLSTRRHYSVATVLEQLLWILRDRLAETFRVVGVGLFHILCHGVLTTCLKATSANASDPIVEPFSLLASIE